MKKYPALLLLLGLLGSCFGLVGFGESNVFSIIESTTPVELSSFAAVMAAQDMVSVNWTSQSETGLFGYRVYRAQSPELAGAMLMTPTCIPATNTSQPHHYSYADREVELNNTYYYWLESMDGAGSNYYGPVSVTLEDSSTPPLPVTTLLRTAYPNPFQTALNLDIQVKEGEAALLSIYNLAGQLVKTETLSPGSHKLVWNGRDTRGRACASGIYLVRLSSPSYNCTTKMVLVK